MERTLIKNLAESKEQSVQVAGWVETIRSLKKMQFLIVRDHTGKLQAIHERLSGEDRLGKLIDTLTTESAVELTGRIIHNPQVKLNSIEMVIEDVTIANLAEAPLPLQENPSPETRLDWRFLDLRTPDNYALFQIQTTVEHAMRTFWQENEFIEIHSPKLMGSASESGAELFKVGYFEREAYLAQSPQFYKQMAMAAGFNRVFEIGPVFRANPSFTSRHDTEFTSVDVEISWIHSHEEVMGLEERWLQYLLTEIKKKHGEEIKKRFGVEVTIPTIPFPRITMKDAYQALSKRGYEVTRGEKGDLDPEGERSLAQHIMEEQGHEFVFVTDYPISVRPFYHMRYEDDPTTTKSFDLLWKGLEVTTGAQREHRYEVLLRQAREKGLNPEPISYYMDIFRYGCPPHGGYGFGLTRMLMVLLGIRNVRDVTFLYRGPNRLLP